MPASPTVNGQPFVTPVSFGYDKPEWALNPTPALTVEGSLAVGELVQVQANNYAVRADASDAIEANAVAAQLLTDNSFYWTTDFQMWMTVSGASTSDWQPLWLGESGAFTVTPPSAGTFNQQVGFTAKYRPSDGKHLVRLIPRPVQQDIETNDSGSTVSKNYVYGYDSSGNVTLATAGSSPIPPRFVALRDTPAGDPIPIGRIGRFRMVAELSGAYTINGPAWISGTTAGTVTRTRPSGYYWQVGTFAETARDGNNTILVDAMFDPKGGKA